MRFPTYISEGMFTTRFNRVMSNGWGDLNVSRKRIAITGKGIPSGTGALFGPIGMILSAAGAEKTTLKISYDKLLDCTVEGNKLTLLYLNRRGEEKTIMLKPFRKKGLFGGTGPQAQAVAEMIDEFSSADPEGPA